jgi:hypothetical protein
MNHRAPIRPADEHGVAMIVAILLLLLVSAIGLSSVDRSGDEATTA